jgi:pyrimidine-nucleoside phosphorylase
VGDKISLPLAPLAAECGVVVPMISGRGLGHTGGTLDKLEAIPGFRVDLDLARFRRVLTDVGVAMIGQTGEIAPADKRLYALRDVTATVDSIPLIASSIMSKKLAEGIDGLVLDVKVGSGAFMKRESDARALAQALLSIAGGMGKRARAYLTDMSQPLGAQVGNALEVVESIETLKGHGPEDVTALTLDFAAAMIVLAGLEPDLDQAKARAASALYSGRALTRFQKLIEAQGGDPRVCDDVTRLPLAAAKTPVLAARAGYVARVDTESVGIASMMLGAGRQRSEDAVDPAVGLTVRARLGDHVDAGQPLAVLWHHPGQDTSKAEARLLAAYELRGDPVEAPRLVRDVLETA